MPENIDGLLDAFGVQQQETPTESTESEPTTVDNTETPEVTTEEETVAQPTVEAQIEQERSKQAFAAMRAENSKYKKFMQTLMKGSNYVGDEQAFIDALENEAYKKQAQLQGLAANPELLKKLDQQEESIRQLTQSQRDAQLMYGLKALQETNNLTGKEVEEFVRAAIENKIDLYTPGVSYDALYKGLFFNKIVDKRIEDERQKWISQSNKSNSAATPGGKSGKKDPDKTDIQTMTELNSLLNNVSKDLN